MPDQEIAAAPVPPDGSLVATPPLRGGEGVRHRVIVEGVVRCAYNGTEFDAVYRTDRGGAFRERHRYLEWSPNAPTLLREDPAAHRYEFAVPETWRTEGRSLGVGVSIPRLVDELLIPPSEVRASLSGGLTFRLMETSPAAALNPWLAAAVGTPVVLGAAGLGWVLRRRMRFAGLSPDLRAIVERVEQKWRIAAAEARRWRRRETEAQLRDLRDGAVDAAQSLQQVRSAGMLGGIGSLESEIAALRAKAAAAPAAEREQIEATLAAKRSALAAAERVRQIEERLSLRLTRIEALLDAACLTFRGTEQTGNRPGEEALCRELDAELSALREVADQEEQLQRLHSG
jgi:hypothetical protein